MSAYASYLIKVRTRDTFKHGARYTTRWTKWRTVGSSAGPRHALEIVSSFRDTVGEVGVFYRGRRLTVEQVRGRIPCDARGETPY